MENCGHMVKCWDYLRRPCVRPRGHMDSGNPNCHNPFSDTPPPNAEVITIRKPVVAVGTQFSRKQERERELVIAA